MRSKKTDKKSFSSSRKSTPSKPVGKKTGDKSPFEKFYREQDKLKEDDFFEVSKPGRRPYVRKEDKETKPFSTERTTRTYSRSGKSEDRGSSYRERGNSFGKSEERRSSYRERSSGSGKLEERGSSYRERGSGSGSTFERGNRRGKEDAPFSPAKKTSYGERKSIGEKKYSDNRFDKPKEGKKFESRSEDRRYTSERSERPPYKKTGDKAFGKSEGSGKKDFFEFIERESKSAKGSRGKQERDYTPAFDKKTTRRSGDRDQRYDDRGYRSRDQYDDRKKSKKKEEEGSGIMWLSKFIAQCGVCSRRKAADIIKEGGISVNGKVETHPAYEVQDKDVVTYQGKVLAIEDKKIYLLMNKPKNVITTADDEKGRKTVLDLVKEEYAQRLFPVGRLDRNTTGLLLLTNDGDLTKKLSHPSHQIKKVYNVTLDKNLSLRDLEKIKEGLELEDGLAEVDAVDYIEGGKKNEIGIELHSGKNRIVRRIFEHLGYEVEKLDRTLYAGLTKKDLPRGFYRPLTDKEIIMLRHFTNMRKG